MKSPRCRHPKGRVRDGQRGLTALGGGPMYVLAGIPTRGGMKHRLAKISRTGECDVAP